jgi:hypothetical protein
MLALNIASLSYFLCGNYAAANAQVYEVVALADEKGTSFWKAFGTMNHGCALAVTGKASDAIHGLPPESPHGAQ